MNASSQLKRLKSIISSFFNLDIFYSRRYFSQEGEDAILSKIFHDIVKGFYVDVGAHHPYRYSNTHLLYKKGWSGINIDATDESIQLLNLSRQRDTNIMALVGKNGEKATFFQFLDSALNTTSKSAKKSVIGSGQSKLLKTTKITKVSLSSILKNHDVKHINLLNIDVEGSELEILSSLNLKRYRPDFILVEIIGLNDNSKIKNTDVGRYLYKKGYSLVASTQNSYLFGNLRT